MINSILKVPVLRKSWKKARRSSQRRRLLVKEAVKNVKKRPKLSARRRETK